jgi:hypothetical protein
VGLAHDLILADGADRRIARPLVSKCSIGGNFRAPCDGGVSVQVSVIPRAREVRFVRLTPTATNLVSHALCCPRRDSHQIGYT